MTTETDLRQTGERVQQLLEELHNAGDRRVSLVAEELVRSLTSLYGSGLEHMMAAAEATDAAAVLEAFAADELVSSLLILHGLHPLDTETRIERGLERVRPYLASHGGDVEVIGLEGDGVLRLRLKGSCDGCGSSAMTMKHAVEAAVMELAPEVVALEVEGLAQPRYDMDDFIPLENVGQAERLSDWKTIALLPMVHGEVVPLTVDGVPLVVARIEGDLYAYRGECGSCRQRLRETELADDQSLTCASCGSRYDLRLAGRRLDGGGLPLQPVPLLQVEGGVRLALASEAR